MQDSDRLENSIIGASITFNRIIDRNNIIETAGNGIGACHGMLWKYFPKVPVAIEAMEKVWTTELLVGSLECVQELGDDGDERRGVLVVHPVTSIDGGNASRGEVREDRWGITWDRNKARAISHNEEGRALRYYHR